MTVEFNVGEMFEHLERVFKCPAKSDKEREGLLDAWLQVIRKSGCIADAPVWFATHWTANGRFWPKPSEFLDWLKAGPGEYEDECGFAPIWVVAQVWDSEGLEVAQYVVSVARPSYTLKPGEIRAESGDAGRAYAISHGACRACLKVGRWCQCGRVMR